MNEARRALERRLRRQAVVCGRLGSPLYARLLEHVARDVEAHGPSWKVLRGHDLPPGSSPALRLMGAVHRIVLEGRAPGLAAYYPTAGGQEPPSVTDAAWGELRSVLEEHPAELRRRMREPVQTNEVGRAAALVGGFAVVAATTKLPLRVLEIGASAGLNLRFDHFAYEVDGRLFVDPASPVRFRGVYGTGGPPLAVSMRVVDRRGCDINPLDPITEETRLRLLSYVWPDQVDRVRTLEGALEVARRVPADVEQQSAALWLRGRLARQIRGTATVLFHSSVTQYLAPPERELVDDLVARAASRATAAAPLARLAMEPAGELADVRLTIWPDGSERLLARAGYHGRPVLWLA